MNLAAPRVIRGNRGDLLSRFGLLQAMREEGIEEIAVTCNLPEDMGDLPFKAVPYGFLYNLIPSRDGRKALRRAKAVLHMGGLDLQDDSSLIKLIHTYAVFKSFRAQGLPIYVLMQGAGPITTSTGRILTRHILEQTTAFVARDPATFRLLKGINPAANVILGYDGIFAGRRWPGQPSPGEEDYLKEIIGRESGRPVIGFNLRLWFHFHSSLLPYHLAKKAYLKRAEAGMRRFVDVSSRLIKRLREQLNARVVLISMYQPGTEPWEDDQTYLGRVKSRFLHDLEVVETVRPLSLMAFFRLIGSLDLMIGTRLHATLAAIRHGVPAINLSYTLKGGDIFSYLGLSDQVVGLEAFMENPESLLSLALRLIGNAEVKARELAAARLAIDINHRTIQQLLSSYAS